MRRNEAEWSEGNDNNHDKKGSISIVFDHNRNRIVEAEEPLNHGMKVSPQAETREHLQQNKRNLYNYLQNRQPIYQSDEIPQNMINYYQNNTAAVHPSYQNMKNTDNTNRYINSKKQRIRDKAA